MHKIFKLLLIFGILIKNKNIFKGYHYGLSCEENECENKKILFSNAAASTLIEDIETSSMENKQ